MTPYETIRLAARSLGNSESVRGVCPWCSGGRTKEESFLITRQGDSVKYLCFRASCTSNSRGILSIVGAPSTMPSFKPKEREHVLTKETFPVEDWLVKQLDARYQLTRQAIDFYGITQTKDGDIVIPIYNSRGLIQGHELRFLFPAGGPKAIRYNGADSDGIGWFNSSPKYILPDEYIKTVCGWSPFVDNAIILVEDLYSAMKANYFMHSAALLGTFLSPQQAGVIAQQKYDKVFLALDADATAKAVHIAARYRAMMPNSRVVMLNRDIKDMSYFEVGTFLNDICGSL